jgi:hypothetical protein
MKIYDLQIGFFVYYDDRQVSISSISWTDMIGIKDERLDITVDITELRPIPISEKWMESFGFTLYPWGWVKDDILISPHYRLSLGNGLIKKIQYVHEVQQILKIFL